VNVDGSDIVAREGLRAGVSRMVMVSSIAVYGRIPDGDADETTSYAQPGDLYAATKREAEERVLDLHRRDGLPVVVVQPTCVYGPYGLAFTIDPLRELSTRQVALVNGGDGLCNAVYVDDVADALILAATQAPSGEKFLISGAEPVTWREFYGAYERMMGRCSTVSLSLEEIRARANQGPQPFRIRSEHTLEFLAARTRFCVDKARRLLAYDPRFDLTRGMQVTEAWARWAGLLANGDRA
jgi:nucleoside-diphosphate-sugar epimerase